MITNQQEHYESKKRLNELYRNRNNSPQERDEFYDLLHEIAQYEIESGMINENEFKNEQNQ